MENTIKRIRSVLSWVLSGSLTFFFTFCEVMEPVNQDFKETTSDMEVVTHGDTYAVEGQPSSNKGTETTVNSNSASSFRKYPFIKFWMDEPDITVLSARLRLYVDSGTGTSGSTDVWSTQLGWLETDLTWNNMPSTISKIGSFDHEDTGNTIEVDLDTDYVTGDGTFSFALISDDTNGRIDYASKEYATSSLRPTLVIIYEPN